MPRVLVGVGFVSALILFISAVGAEPDKPKADIPELADFRTVETAETTEVRKGAAVTSSSAGQTGYLGVHVELGDKGQLVVAVVAPDSPAEKAGFQVGDLLLSVEGRPAGTADEFRSLLQSKSPGAALKATVLRKENTFELSALLGATSRPLTATSGSDRPVLGVRLAEGGDDGVKIEQINRNSPAEKAGLLAGDVIIKIGDAVLSESLKLADALATKRPGDKVTVVVRRDDKEADYEIELAADTGGNFGFGNRGGERSGENRGGGYWKKDVYRLAIVLVEYPDVKHNDKVSLDDWTASLFSTATFNDKKNATGQQVFGSLNDYYIEQSYGNLRVEGKVFDWVEMSKKRSEYSSGSGTSSNEKSAFLREALDKLLERDGKEALAEFDGVFILFAGDRVRTTRGGLYWPHRGSVTHNGKRWPYFIVQEGGRQMTNISVMCHEFGHMLGLPDLYARPENPGSEGVSVWCAMSNQAPNGRPQHFSAWCKEQLGWLKPAVIDPTVKQKLVLSPVEDSPKECYKVLVRQDGSEYLLLENRRQKGFDSSLPAEGLLIWRVVNNKPILEESHGVEGPAGPGIYRDLVPFPSRANNAFTPFTTPSSRGQLGGGLPVHLTNIREHSDGRISFYVGYEFQ